MPGLTDDSSRGQIETAPQPFLPGRWRWFAHALLPALLVLTWGWLIWRAVIPALRENTWPYSAYWIGPRLALDGRANLIYAEGSAYQQEIDRLGVSGDIFHGNMPTTLLPFLPLALLPITDAFRVWTVVSLGCFAVGWLALLRTVRLPVGMGLLLTAAVPLFEPFSQNIRGQVYLTLFALVTMSAVFSVAAPASTAAEADRSRGRQIVGGLMLGVAALLKLYYGLVLALPAIVKRRWTFLLSASVVVGTAFLVTAWAWGTGIWAHAIYLSLTWTGRPETVHTAYQTTHSLIGRLFRYDAQWNPAPVADLPWLVAPLWWLVAGSTVGVTVLTLWRSSRRGAAPGVSTAARQLLAPAVMVPLASALAPIAEGYHYALCLFPSVVVMAVLYEAWRQQPWVDGRQGRGLPQQLLAASAGLVLALVLLGVPWQYNVARVDGWASLMHYPRLYGALVLWLLTVVLLVRPNIIEKVQTGVTSGAAP
jgi:hypothetical protein